MAAGQVNEWVRHADTCDVRDWLYPYYCGAGRGARAKYDEAYARWRKRVFRKPRLIYALLGGAIVIGAVVERHNVWLWVLGVVLGAVLGGYIGVVESPPAYIENWRTGSEGERSTARALAPLRRRGYVLLHDLSDRRTGKQRRKGNIDHVVVSTGGVFLLDSKCLGGEASIRRGTVRVQRRDDDEESYDLPWLAPGMRGRAVRLQEDIEAQTGVRFVQPVVVFWNPFEAGVVVGQNVVFVHGERLVGWLEEQRPTMAADMVARVAEGIAVVRPPEHRAWWDRLPASGMRGRGALLAPPTGGGVTPEI